MIKISFETVFEYKPIKHNFFKNKDDVKNYFNSTFSYVDVADLDFIFNSLDDNCSAFSCNLRINKKPIISISAEYQELYSFDVPKAWGGTFHSIFEVFPNEDAFLIQEKWNQYISTIQETEECIDSYRICLKDDKESEEQFQKLISCCGSNHTEFTINNNTYIFGCNFGH